MISRLLRTCLLLLPCWLFAAPASAATTATPVCPPGYTLNGTSCRAPLSCPPLTTPSGGQCTRTLTTTYTASCPSGTQLWSNYCAAYDMKTRGPSNNRTAPTCNRGGTLGTNGLCTITTTQTSKLSCPAEGSPVAGLYCQATPYCPTGFKLIGGQCKK